MDLSLIVRGIIKKRRTTVPEDFNGKKVDHQIVQEILEAANWAPTHGQTEPWRFIVYEYEKVAEFGKFHANLYKDNTEPEQFLQKKHDKLLHRADKASHVIVVYLKRTDKKNIPLNEEISAVSCAVQNMLLVAASHQVASYWGTGGMCYDPSMKAALKLEEEDMMMGFIFLGKIANDDFPEGKRNTSIAKKTIWI